MPGMERKTLLVIPTYDERENVRLVADAVFRAAPQAEILFVDDDSPDGTAAAIAEMAASDPRIHLMNHGAKAGLGRAYVDGFRWGLARGYELLFEMDADLSHDPKEIPAFVAAAESGADLVLGTRYKGGIRVINWPLNRLLISMFAGTFVRAVTALPVSDPTGGYKCYTARVLKAINLDRIVSNGYSFQIETTFEAWRRGFKIAEVPIVFEDRRSGQSKFSRSIAREAFFMVFSLAWRNRFRRKPGLAGR
ncbi:MAG: polyprenol monophosphomannose synthase [Kiritimatiellae bacterium]|nr:polyprenol monophosphomannose synthase [Kiritimatiellia bacterium]